MNALTTVAGAQPMMARNLANLDFDKLDAIAKAYAVVSNRMPGERLAFKKGKWQIGARKDKKSLANGTELVANIVNLVAAWQKWEGDEDSRKLTVHSVAYILDGEKLPPREILGDLDEDDWEIGKYSKAPEDPWKEVYILLLRDQEDGNLYRLEADTISGKNALRRLIGEYAKEARNHADELPIIALDFEEVSNASGDFEVPVYDIVGWAEPSEDDFPEGGFVGTAGNGDGEDDEDEAPRGKKGKKAPAKKPAPKKARRVEEDEEDEDEDEDDVRPPKKSAAKKSPIRREEAEDAETEDEDDEDDVKVHTRGKKEKVGSKIVDRRAKSYEEDEDEENDDDEDAPREPVRRRRRAPGRRA